MAPTTNAQLEIMLVRFEGKLDLMNADMSLIKDDVSTVKKALWSNGKVGLLDDHKELKRCFEAHEKQHTDAENEVKEKKKNFSAKTWAVILILITQTAGLLFLYLRPL